MGKLSGPSDRVKPTRSIDDSRGHPALDQYFAEEFRGVLVTDFWAAYDAIGRAEQSCWPHLLRELNEVDAG